MRIYLVVFLLILSFPLLTFSEENDNTLHLFSPSFNDGEGIPREFTGDGIDISPPLEWKNVPSGTKSIAIIMVDPDALGRKPWIHWVVYNISPVINSLPRGVNVTKLPLIGMFGAQSGINSWNTIGYKGPFPPKGSGIHHYHFSLYALDNHVEVQTFPDEKLLLRLINGHIIAKTELIGNYER